MFSTTGGHKPIGNFSKTKNKLTHHSGVENWTYHDFRRAMATQLEQNGCDRYTIMFALNHTDTSSTAVYDRSLHLKNKLNALRVWNKIITQDIP